MFESGKYSGEVIFELKEPYFSIMGATFNYFFSKEAVIFNEEKLIINCPQTELGALYDALLFLEKFGEIKEAFVCSTFGIKNIHVIFLKSNKLQEYKGFVTDSKYLYNDYRKNHLSIVEKAYKETYIKTSYSFLKNAEIDINEKRKINIEGYITYLYEPFMKLLIKDGKDRENNILLQNGQWATPCSQCIFRLRKTTTGCNPCLPKKTTEH